MKETPADTLSSDDITQRWLEVLCRRTEKFFGTATASRWECPTRGGLASCFL